MDYYGPETIGEYERDEQRARYYDDIEYDLPEYDPAAEAAYWTEDRLAEFNADIEAALFVGTEVENARSRNAKAEQLRLHGQTFSDDIPF